MTESMIVDSPIGWLTITVDDDAVIALDLLRRPISPMVQHSPFIRNVRDELKEYFLGLRMDFDIPLNPMGTPFQERAWAMMQRIPFGATQTYGQLAESLNSHPRTIGQACRANPIPILLPCHRVVAQSSLGGYAGTIQGNILAIKQWLIDHEHQYAETMLKTL